MYWQTQRKAFSMITAIVIMVLMSSVAVLIMDMTGKLVKETTAQFQGEQAALYANSYTEYAVMAVTANNRAANCLTTINTDIGTPDNGQGYRILVQISYISTGAEIGTCPALNTATAVNTPSTPLTIVVDAYVRYKELEHHNTSVNAPFITYHRRTVQKI